MDQVSHIIDDGGLECPNCGEWRCCSEGGMVEDCRNDECGDEGFDLTEDSGP